MEKEEELREHETPKLSSYQNKNPILCPDCKKIIIPHETDKQLFEDLFDYFFNEPKFQEFDWMQRVQLLVARYHELKEDERTRINNLYANHRTYFIQSHKKF